MHDIFYNTTGVPPSELLFNRVIKGKLPVINSKKIVNRDIKKLETMKKHDKNATENMQIKGETKEKVIYKLEIMYWLDKKRKTS